MTRARLNLILPILGLVLVGAIAAIGTTAHTIFRAPAEASSPIEATSVASTSADATIFEIDQENSEARFIVDEVLRGSPYTVVGATNQVAGQVALNPADFDAPQVGVIRINARTLTTDNNSRNRMLMNSILQTDQHEYITFVPTGVSGLPATAQVGQTYPVQITGDLTIKSVTRPVTFDTTVTLESADQLTGKAQANIRFADWGISIPQVPTVTGVSEQVRLELDFVAAATGTASAG